MIGAVLDHHPVPEQCCALNEDGSRCLEDTFQGWHFCESHLHAAASRRHVELVEEVADKSPIQQRTA
jgi:hypothetical protein